MGRKEEYKLQNERYLEALRAENDIRELPCGILYRVLEEGNGGNTPRLNYNRQIKKFPTEKQNVSLKHILT